jgi:hypothetical protein
MHRKTLLFLSLSGVILLCLSALVLIDVRCILIQTDDGEVVHVTSVRNGDSLVISHINSIYDAPVEEHLEVDENQFALTRVVTDSQGVLEYYGIADTTPRGKWSVIRIFSTEGRNFAFTIKGIPVDTLKERRHSHFNVHMQDRPLYLFLFWKVKAARGQPLKPPDTLQSVRRNNP